LKFSGCSRRCAAAIDGIIIPRKNTIEEGLLTSPLGRRFEEALVYASRIHATQLRKGTTRPYIGHLLGVTSLVLAHGGDEDEAIAALLHDAVEDQGGKPRLREIRRKYGPRVARIVLECSDTDEIPKPPWLARKEKYLRHLRKADASVRLVSAADKLHNAREILSDYRLHGELVWKKFSAPKKMTLWYYREVANILLRKGPRDIAGELNRVVTELEEISRL
jgi:GTP pyrophosphokinase